MSNVAVLAAAISGGVTAAIVAIIIIACYRYYKQKKQPKFSRNTPRKRLMQPPVPKPDVRTSPLTQVEKEQAIAAKYVESDIQQNQQAPPVPDRSLKPQSRQRTTSPVQARTMPAPLFLPGREFQGGDSPDGSSSLHPLFARGRRATAQEKRSSLPSLPSSGPTSPVHSRRRPETEESEDGNVWGSRSVSPAARRKTRISDFMSMDGGGSEDLRSSLPKYTQPSGDHNSSPDDDASNPLYRGHLKFHLEYRYDSHALRFRPLQSKHIKPTNRFSGTADVFLKVFLVLTNELPADGKVSMSRLGNGWRSKTYRQKHSPKFDHDDFNDFQCSLSRVGKMGLLIYVFDYDKYSRDSVIGHIWLPLVGVDISGSQPRWQKIQKGVRIRDNAAEMNHGSLQFSLMYQAGLDHLTVLVRKASRLTTDSVNYTSAIDPYVSVSLLRHGRRVARKDTPASKSTTQPVFNVAVRFDHVTACGSVASGSISECSVLLTVRDKTRLRSDTVIGSVLVGHMAQSESGQQHWEDMIASCGEAKERMHPLGSKPSKKTLKHSATMLQLSSAENSPYNSDEEEPGNAP